MRNISRVIVLLAGLALWLPGQPRAAEQPVFRIGTHVSTFGSKTSHVRPNSLKGG